MNTPWKKTCFHETWDFGDFAWVISSIQDWDELQQLEAFMRQCGTIKHEDITVKHEGFIGIYRKCVRNE